MSKAPKRYTQLPFALDTLESTHLTLLNPASWDDRNDAELLDSYRASVGAESIYALCLTTKSSTYHHWKIYAGSNSGVCIHFSETRLRKWASSEDIQVLDMEYLSLKRAKSFPVRRDDLPRLKRHAFEDEAELRLLYKCAEPQSPARSFKIPPELIVEIELNPWLPDFVYRSIETTIHRIAGFEHTLITQSHMLTNVEWRGLLARARDDA